MKLGWGAWVGIIVGGLGGLFGLIVGIAADPVGGSVMAFIFVLAFSGVFIFFLRPVFSSSKLLKTGVQRPGKIVGTWDTGVTINNNPEVGLTVELKGDDGKTYQAKTRMVVSRLQTAFVQAGVNCVLRVDPKNPEKVAVESIGDLSDDNDTPVSANVTTDTTTSDEYKTDMEKIILQNDTENKEIMLNGISAQAKVIAVHDLNVKVNGNNPYVMMELQVFPGLQDPYFAQTKGIIKEEAIDRFKPGAMIDVKYDRNDPSKVTVVHS